MRQTKVLFCGMLIAQALIVAPCFFASKCVGQGAVQLEFADKESGEPVSARISFTKSAKKLTKPRNVLFASDHWLAEKRLPLILPNGDFEFTVQRGPEFSQIQGGFTIESRAKDTVRIDVPRSISMRDEKWYSGDHLSPLPPNELRRWQFADAVDLAVSAESNPATKPGATKTAIESKVKTSKSVDSQSPNLVGLGLDAVSRFLQWEHGAILLHGNGPREITSNALHDSVDAFQWLEDAKNRNDLVAELVRPWSRDVPLLLACDSIRSVQILSSCNRPGGDDRIVLGNVNDKRILGKALLTNGKDKTPSEIFAPFARDETVRFKDARGLGKLSEAIYWQMLEAGLKITPTAGSGFDGNDTHVGYNRVYAYHDTVPNEASWWQAIAKGHNFVTNGPLLRASINGLPPGSVQSSYRSQNISLDIAVSLAVRDPVDYLDVVFNGDTIYSAKLEEHYRRGEFPPIEINKSGWLVIRVVTEHTKGYRFATTAPFYFVFDGRPRVSKKGVSFFQQWQNAAEASLAESVDELAKYQPWIARSKPFWESRLRDSNAE